MVYSINYGNSTPTLHTHLNTTHISVAGSYLDVMLTDGPAMFPGVCGGSPSPPLPPAAAVRWLWLRHLECQEGRGTPRGQPQELDDRGAVGRRLPHQLSSSWGALTVQYFTGEYLTHISP